MSCFRQTKYLVIQNKYTKENKSTEINFQKRGTVILCKHDG